jgi:ATP-dependent RNA helicase RhlE
VLNVHHSKFINKPVAEKEEDVYLPKHAFNDFDIHPDLKATVASRNYKQPSPIQDQAIPHVLAGRDVVGLANTGTGKTAAFLIPLINKAGFNPEKKVLIIAPTRELAIQIQEEFKLFAKGLNMYSVCVVGGASAGPQLSGLSKLHHFVIGTPGRINDMIERGRIKLKDFSTIVLDEADRMLDMGFIDDMRAIMAGMPADRQTVFFSATLSPDIEKLIHQFLKDPVRIKVSKTETATSIEQDVVFIEGKEKIDLLHDLLTQPEFARVLVFSGMKHAAEKLSDMLNDRGFRTDSIHGDKRHSQRQRALQGFKDGKIQVLVATDVAARGIDVADVSHVINYDLPQTYEDYVHRIGRTGRGSKKGKALTFVPAPRAASSGYKRY